MVSKINWQSMNHEVIDSRVYIRGRDACLMFGVGLWLTTFASFSACWSEVVDEVKVRTYPQLDDGLQAEARVRFLPRFNTDLADAIVGCGEAARW
jgi:hypothetical protein